MLNRDAEVRRLQEAEQDIAETLRSIHQFEREVAAAHRLGRDAEGAARLLGAMRDSLCLLIDHREVLIRTIRGIDAGRL